LRNIHYLLAKYIHTIIIEHILLIIYAELSAFYELKCE